MSKYQLGMIIAILAAFFLSGYFFGRVAIREAALQSAIDALITRGNINHDTEELNSADLCLALGGLRSECTGLMRGMD